MLISPKKAIDNGWITHSTPNFDWSKCIQPNAIDFTLDQAFVPSTTDTATFGVDTKQLPQCFKVTGSWVAVPSNGGYIDGMSSMYCNIPEGVAAMLIIRSTLNRGGLSLAAGLYDSKFQGNIGFVIRNHRSVEALIEIGSRVGQIMFLPSDSVGGYAGGYNTVQGTHWSEKT